MTDDEIKRARELCAAATPGPWQAGTAGRCNLIHFDGDNIHGVALVESRYDGDFIEAARELLPRALDEVERLQDAVTSLRNEYGAGSAYAQMTDAARHEWECRYKALQERNEARTERDQLRATVQELRGSQSHEERYLRAKLDRAVEALRRFGAHHYNCNYRTIGCACGFDGALRGLGALPDGDS